MLPNNFASFMKKMVTSDGSGLAGGLTGGLAGAGGLGGGGLMASSGGVSEGVGSSFRPDYGFGGAHSGDATTALSKLRSTLTTGLQGTVTKLSPTRVGSGGAAAHSQPEPQPSPVTSMGMSQEDRSLLQKVWDKGEKFEPGECKIKAPPIATPTAPTVSGVSPLSPNRRQDKAASRPSRSPSTNCRVCVKTLGESEFFKRCTACNLKVCEDCASYSSSAGTEDENTWHCSICKRRLSSRTRPPDPPPQDTTVTVLPSKPSLSAPMLPTPGKPTALTLMTGIASVASSLASSQTPLQPQPQSALQQSSQQHQQNVATSASSASLQGPSGAQVATQASQISTSSMTPSTLSVGLTSALAYGSGLERRRPSMSYVPPAILTETPKPEPVDMPKKQTNKPQENEQVQDSSVDKAPDLQKKVEADNNNEEVSMRKVSQESDESSSPKEMKRSTSQLSGESSGDESRQEGGRRGRRRSIVRQQSYEEDLETQNTSLLPLWGAGGQLPVRRHSAQGPARRDEALEAARKGRDSLDVPCRTQRHHSCDYDLPNQNLLMATPSGGSSWQSSESDVSSGGQSEVGSTTAIEDNRRHSRASIGRHPGYRGSFSRNNGNQPDTGYIALDSSPSPMSPDTPASHTDHHAQQQASAKAGGVKTSHGSVGRKDSGGTSRTDNIKTQRRPDASPSLSLEEDSFLHPAEDEWRSTRRRSSTASDICRVLPTPPHSPRTAYGMGASGGSRGTASLESNASLSVDDAHRRQSSINDAETIKIVIHDVETDQSRIMKSQDLGRRRVTVHRDMSDINNRARGLGMRVVGGKPAEDGRLVAYVVWIVPTGPADNAGVCQGDKVLEWNGVSLIDLSFEEVCSIIEQTTTLEVIDMVLESSADVTDYRDSDQHRGSLDGWGSLDSEDKHSGAGSSRRKLPRLPSDATRGPVSGKIQLQLWFSQETRSLVVTVISAHDLKPREGIAYAPPQAFVCLRLFPYGDYQMQSSNVSEPSFKPLWNNSFFWENISIDTLLGLTLELSVWDSLNEAESVFLGESLIDLRHAYLDDRPTWYRLQERRSRSANTTPRGSLVGQDFPSQPVRRSSVRSGNDEIHLANDSRHSSLDSGLLHPDLAYRDSRSGSRRGSSVSETVEVEAYQLSRQFPHSLPQSRRSSFACTQPNTPDMKVEELQDRLAFLPPMEERRRARSVKVSSQNELLYEAGWRDPTTKPSWLTGSHTSSAYGSSFRNNLNRSSSLRGDHSIFQGSASSGGYRQDEDIRNSSGDPMLGPCQVLPRGYREIWTDDISPGEILLELSLTKLHLEVIIGSAKGLPLAESGRPPDTYVKTYLKSRGSKFNKRKTKVIQCSTKPVYHQTVRYLPSDALGKILLVMVWEKSKYFAHNKCIGSAEINLGDLYFGKPVSGWYTLLPKLGRPDSDSGESVT